MRRLLLVLTLLALAAGCSRRDRNNPLDPANPATGGRPQGFVALAGYSVVTLHWASQPTLAIDGFQLWRLAPGDASYRPISDVLGPRSGNYVDSGVNNGGLYLYRLYYVIRGTLAESPAVDQATPGPLRIWVADAGAGLTQLTADGRHVLAVNADAGECQSLALDPVTGQVWTSDETDALVTTRGLGDPVPVSIAGLSLPFTIAVDRSDHSAWVCDLSGRVGHYAADGTPASPPAINLLDDPDGIAVNPQDRSVWVCEHDGNRVRHFAANGGAIATTTLGQPARVLADSATGTAWVASPDRGLLFRLNAAGQVLDSSNVATSPIGMAIDHVHGHAWITDALGGRVFALDPVTRQVQFTVGGLGEPLDVQVDYATGDAWVVDQGAHAVVRISASGRVLSSCAELQTPYELRVDAGLETGPVPHR
jgi:DNA-binding beta-propeller fold protein YncE